MGKTYSPRWLLMTTLRTQSWSSRRLIINHPPPALKREILKRLLCRWCRVKSSNLSLHKTGWGSGEATLVTKTIQDLWRRPLSPASLHPAEPLRRMTNLDSAPQCMAYTLLRWPLRVLLVLNCILPTGSVLCSATWASDVSHAAFRPSCGSPRLVLRICRIIWIWICSCVGIRFL